MGTKHPGTDGGEMILGAVDADEPGERDLVCSGASSAKMLYRHSHFHETSGRIVAQGGCPACEASRLLRVTV